MKGKILKFMRLRKQSDMVKVKCLFALAGIAAFASVCFHVWGIYVYADTPAEYVLMGEGLISKKSVDELRQMEGVERVSRQMDETVQVMYRGMSAEVDCTGLSRQYVEGMSGVGVLEGEAGFDGTKKIYMNEAAFSAWKQAVSEKGADISELEAGGPEFEIRYSGVGDALEDGNIRDSGSGDTEGVENLTGVHTLDGEKGRGGYSCSSSIEQWKTAKLVVLEGGEIDEEEEGSGFVCMVETDSRLLMEAYLLRIRFRKHDLDGLQGKALRDLGYEIQNEGVLIEEEYEVKRELLHIQYGLILCAACGIAAWVIGRGVF